MMANIEKISTQQFFILLFLSRLFITLTDIPPLMGGMEATDYLVSVPIYGLFLFISAIPTFFMAKSNTNSNILDRCSCISPVFGKISAFMYVAIFLYGIVLTMARFDMFATSIIFPKTNFKGFLIVIILACMLAAVLGIESIARGSVFVFVAFLGTFFTVVLTITKKIDFLNFSPIFYSGAGTTIKSAFVSVPRTIEIAVVLMSMQHLKGNTRKGMAYWIIGLNVFQAVLLFYMIGVTGGYLKSQLFPAYTLAVVAEFGFLQNVDVFLTSTWILCVFLKISIFLYMIKDCMKVLISKKYSNLYIFISTIIVSVITFCLNPEAYSINHLIKPIVPFILYSICAIIIPCIVLIYEKVKGVKIYES